MFGFIERIKEKRARDRWDASVDKRIRRILKAKPNLPDQARDMGGLFPDTPIKNNAFHIGNNIWVTRRSLFGDYCMVLIAENGDVPFEDATRVYAGKTKMSGAWQTVIDGLLDEQVRIAEIERDEADQHLAMLDHKRANLVFDD